jgi:hypothetical protein
MNHFRSTDHAQGLHDKSFQLLKGLLAKLMLALSDYQVFKNQSEPPAERDIYMDEPVFKSITRAAKAWGLVLAMYLFDMYVLKDAINALFALFGMPYDLLFFAGIILMSELFLLYFATGIVRDMKMIRADAKTPWYLWGIKLLSPCVILGINLMFYLSEAGEDAGDSMMLSFLGITLLIAMISRLVLYFFAKDGKLYDGLKYPFYRILKALGVLKSSREQHYRRGLKLASKVQDVHGSLVNQWARHETNFERVQGEDPNFRFSTPESSLSEEQQALLADACGQRLTF